MTTLRSLTASQLQAEIDRRQAAWEAADAKELAYWDEHKSDDADELAGDVVFANLLLATHKAGLALDRAEREQDSRDFDDVQAEQFGTRYDSPSL